MKIDFSKYSSIGIGPICDVLEIKTIEDYDEYFIIGRANNLLIGSCEHKLAILSKEFDYIKEKEGLLYVGAATKSSKLFNYTKRYDLGGVEFLASLPGNLGGICKMNAGLKEWEIFDYIVNIKTKDGYIDKKDINFGYRYSDISTTIFEVVLSLQKGFCRQKLEMFNSLRANQPSGKSAGSCFKNPSGDYAGRLIEAVGLKGYRIGDIGFSSQHANFLINYGNANYSDAIAIIKEAKKRVFDSFGISLQEEIIVL